MSKDKKSFVFYISWATLLIQMPEDLRHKVEDAILCYVIDGTVPEDDAIRYSAFALIQQQLDTDMAKWEHTREARSHAGRRGNEVRWGKPAASQNIANVASVPSLAVNANVDVNVNGNVNTDVVKEETAIAAKKTPSLTLSQRQEAFMQTLVPYKETYTSDVLNDFFEYWTEPSKSGKKMRFEMEQTWDVSRRLSRWTRNNFK